MKLQLSNGHYLRFEHLSFLLHYVMDRLRFNLRKNIYKGDDNVFSLY